MEYEALFLVLQEAKHGGVKLLVRIGNEKLIVN